MEYSCQKVRLFRMSSKAQCKIWKEKQNLSHQEQKQTLVSIPTADLNIYCMISVLTVKKSEVNMLLNNSLPYFTCFLAPILPTLALTRVWHPGILGKTNLGVGSLYVRRRKPQAQVGKLLSASACVPRENVPHHTTSYTN